MSTRWPRGSQWRLWDLHLHAPDTKLNDQFSSNGGDIWEEYCRRLHDSQVRAFGITDYFSADCYFTARTEYQLRYPDAPKLFLPNVELRTGDVVNKAQEEVNVHLIFNPFLNDHEEKIRSFLGFLKTSKTIGASGKHLRASELKHRADFAEATTTRAFISEALEETYGTDVDLLDYLLIVTAANNDGIRAIRGKQRKLLITDEIDKFSNAFFGNRGNRDYFLRTDRAQEQGEFILQKPVLSGCDAHSLADLDTGLGRVVHDPSGGKLLEPTWIKADLTYEGLKQIIFEPSDRVFIGKEPEIEVRGSGEQDKVHRSATTNQRRWVRRTAWRVVQRREDTARKRTCRNYRE